MNKKLLIVLPVCANDCVLAERLLDFIYKLNSKTQEGHLLIVANPDLHQEFRTKLRVTAEMSFESVTEAVAPAIDQKLANSKFHQMNNLFRCAALIAQTNFRWPWFWLEPDCGITDCNWISILAGAYDGQPKRYMGWVSKADKTFMARCGVYYPGASYELDKLCQGDAPFPLATADKVGPSASHTNLVQYGLILETPEDLAKISRHAVVVHGDKLGLIAENKSVIDMFPCRTAITESVEMELTTKRMKEAATITASFAEEKTESPTINAAKIDSKLIIEPPNIAKFGAATVTEEVVAGLGEVTMIQTSPEQPRLSRRQKRELVQSGSK